MHVVMVMKGKRKKMGQEDDEHAIDNAMNTVRSSDRFLESQVKKSTHK